MTTEAKVTSAITRYVKRLRLAGEQIFFVKLHGGPMQRAGLPDMIILYKGKLLAVEIKKPGGKATLLQQHTMEEMRRAGATCIVATDVRDVAEVLNQWK